MRSKWLFSTALTLGLGTSAMATEIPLADSDVVSFGSVTAPLAYDPCSNCGTPGSYKTTEYLRAWQLDKVGAAAAFARGANGQGIVVGIVDTGVDFRNTDLDGNLLRSSLWAQGPWSSSTAWHGTAVAGVIGAEKNNSGMQGFAYKAQLLPFQGLSPDGIDKVLSWRGPGGKRVRVVNNSWGISYSGNTLYSPSDYAFLVPTFNKALANSAVIVFAAGNEGEANPQAYGRAGYYMSQLDPRLYPNAPLYDDIFLVVVATDSNNQIASWSNRCGMAMQSCIAAPGANVVSTTIGGGLVTVSGTSFSAPAVSGAIAMLMDIWPGLSGAQVVTILKTTATDLGVAGVDNIYGWGLINLDKATQPIGALRTSGSLASGQALTSAGLSGGKALGTAMARSLSA